MMLTACASETVAQDCPCGPPTFSPRMRQLLIPQEFADADFRPACRAHDRCYEVPGIDRKLCDDRYLADVKEICQLSSRPWMCERLANTMYRAERVFGQKAYLIRQRVINPRRVYWH